MCPPLRGGQPRPLELTFGPPPLTDTYYPSPTHLSLNGPTYTTASLYLVHLVLASFHRQSSKVAVPPLGKLTTPPHAPPSSPPTYLSAHDGAEHVGHDIMSVHPTSHIIL